MSEAIAAHVEAIAYADDYYGPDGLPEDYERHYCEEDGEDWPCRTVLIAGLDDALAALVAAQDRLGVIVRRVEMAEAINRVLGDQSRQLARSLADLRDFADPAPKLCEIDCHRRPGWMGVDQHDEHPCVLASGHDGRHICRHDAEEAKTDG